MKPWTPYWKEALVAGRLESYRQVLGRAEMRWEMILRCQCAEGLLRWPYRKPKGIRLEPATGGVIYRELLIEFWRTNALRWAAKDIFVAGTRG